jgi:autotransporter-associated beta strand protein
MKHYHLRELAALSGVIVMTQLADAASFEWTGASGIDLNWSTPGNWSPAGPPDMADEARFLDTGSTNDNVSINNIVSADITIERLWVGPTNGLTDGSVIAAHNMLINQGVTLTIKGTNDNGSGPIGSQTPPDPNPLSTYHVGTKSYVSGTTAVTNTVSGGGTLFLDNPNNELNVRQIHATGTGQFAVMDMSGLNTFIARLGRIRIGDGEAEPIRRAKGVVRLARTNNITLSGPNQGDNVQLVIGNNDVNNPGNGGASFLYLGEKNTLSIDEILVGARKTQGNILFNDNLTAPSIRLRGSDGASRVRALRIGDESDQNASGNPTTGRIDLSAGTADIMADRVVVGKHQTGGGQSATGFLIVGAGTLDVNTLDLADQTDAQADTSATAGTATFTGTFVQVNNLLRLGRSTGGDGAINATLNIDEGTVTVLGSYTNQGTVNIGLTNAHLNLPPNSRVEANVVVIDGSTISNAARLTVTNQLTVLNGGTIAGNPALNLGNSGAANWDFTLVPGGLVVSNSLSGAGNVLGDVTVTPGASISPAGAGVGAAALNISGNATLNNARLLFDLSTNATDLTSDLLTVSANLTLNGTSDVVFNNLGGFLDTASKYTLVNYAGTLTGSASNFRAAGPLAESRYTFAFDTVTPAAIQLSVGGSGPKNLTWVGDGTANVWDAKGAMSWNNGAGADQFFSLDSVTFNDSGSASPSVSLMGALKPGSFVVSNPTKNYAFNGTGGVSPGGPLTKDGAGALTFNNSGDNAFAGPVTVRAGAVTFSNSGLNTFANGLAVNGDSVIFAGNSTNVVAGGSLSIAFGASLAVSNANANTFGGGLIDLDGTLTFNQAVDATLDGILSGGGALIKGGTNTLTLANDNSALSAVVQINSGAVKAGVAGALGSVGAIVASGAKLDINGQNLGAIPITASGSGPNGEGAIVSTAGAQGAGLDTVTLAGHTAFGGSGAWNTDPVLNVGLWTLRASLSTGNQPYNLIKVGPNQVTLAGVAVDAALGDIDVQQGLLDFRGGTTSMGNPANTLTVRAGATVSFFDTTTAWDKKIVLFGDGVTPNLFNYNGANTIPGPVTLNGNCVVSAAPPDRGAPASLTLSGPVGGSGALIKTSSDTLVLSAANTYTGDTIVNTGTLALSGIGSVSSSSNIALNTGATLDASGRTDSTLTLASGQTLKGNGAIIGNVTASPGSAVSPGLSLGITSVSGNVSFQGTTTMELDASLRTNDVLRAAVINYGGTLSLSVVAGNLVSGDSFKLFDAGTYNGSFASIVPATPGPGLTWITTNLTADGTLRVGGGGVAQPEIGAVTVSGSDIIISGTGGAPGGSYYVLASTNVALPLINWTPLATNAFTSSGAFVFTNAVNPDFPRQFFLLQLP